MRYEIPAYCTFKTPEVQSRTNFICSMLTEVLYAMASYCKDRALPLEITDSVSTPEEDKALSRVSDEHSTARAFDMSVRGWKEPDIVDFINHFSSQFSDVAAIGLTSHQPHLIFRHNNGHGDHLHVQLARGFGVKNPLKLGEPASEVLS